MDSKQYNIQILRLRLAWSLYGFKFLIKTLRRLNGYHGVICRCGTCHILFRDECDKWTMEPSRECKMKQFLQECARKFNVIIHFEHLPHQHFDKVVSWENTPGWVRENAFSNMPAYKHSVHLVIDEEPWWTIEYGKRLWNVDTVEHQFPYFKMVHYLSEVYPYLDTEETTDTFDEWFDI